MTLALRHTYPLKWWQTVWTIFIEKEIGNPNINRLRCIMLFEADWQLLLKWHLSYRFLPKTKLAGTLVTVQGGGHKGWSMIDQATQQILETEIIQLNQHPAIDLQACFDMMVKACRNLACHRHGTNIDYLHLHACTHQLMHYYKCNKFSVSRDYNTYEQHLWHGAGQGAADAVLRYIVLSDTLINLYHTKVAPAMMFNPTTMIKAMQSLKAFINDTVLHATDPNAGNIQELTHRAASQIWWWDQLVKVTSGALNLKKYCGMAYEWEPDHHGILELWNNVDAHTYPGPSQGNWAKQILQPHEGMCYLGLYITTDQNTKLMEVHLWDKATVYTTAFHHTPMNHWEASVLYCSCLLPALTYPLPAMWLLDTFFTKVHQLSTSTILNKMG